MRFERVKRVWKSEPEFDSLYAIEILPAQASSQLEILNKKYPLPSHLEHVKRIWRRQNLDKPVQLLILLSLEDGEYGLEDWKEFIKKEFTTESTNEIKVFKVPKRMPHTRKEYELWRSLGYWPTAFHENKSLIKEELKELEQIIKFGEIIIPKLISSGDNMIIIMDPQFSDEKDWVRSKPTPSPLYEPVMMAINEMANKQSQSQSQSSVIDKESLPYLCTGCFAFCIDEPSIMSSMALVHSRIKCVIFVNPNIQRGGLCTLLRLQEVDSINHHFSVYRCHLDS